MKLTKELLEKSLELCEKATPGPWLTESYCDDNGKHRWTTIHDGKTGYGDDIIGDTNLGICSTDTDKKEEKENAAFIAHHNPEFIKELIQANIEALKVLKSYEHISAQPDSEVTRFSAAAEYLSKYGGVE